MNEWLQQILSSEFQGDKSDSNLSPQSLVTRGTLSENLKNSSKNPSDKSDKQHLSLLSPKNEHRLDQNLNKGGGVTSDRSDKTHLSGLSGENQDQDHHNQNLQHILQILTDKPDLEIQSILDDFEERCAIVEYDGGCSALEAERTAYKQALINVLSSYDGTNTQTERS